MRALKEASESENEQTKKAAIAALELLRKKKVRSKRQRKRPLKRTH